MHRTCATCRFMSKEPRGITIYGEEDRDPADEQTKHHTCARIIHGNGDAQGVPATRHEPALVVDGSGFAARLIVLPSFACNLHAPKEP